MPTAIRVARGDKTFAARRALAGVQFDVGAGERVALIGASGSGKSTLLRCLCGLETLDAGTSEVDLFERPLQRAGRLVSNVRELRRDVGIVFQQFNLVGRLPVMTNVLMGIAAEQPLWRAVTGAFPDVDKARALDVLGSVGLSEQAFQRASTLSGGQQQRAAVARVLLQGAKLLLADEPVASLDPESTRRVMDLLLELNRQRGITLVISLHNVALARRYCERAIALRNGVVVFDGSTNALSPTFLKNLYGTDAEELLAEDELGGRSSFGDNVIPVPYPMSVAAAA